MAMNGSVLTNVPKKIKTQKSDPYAPAIFTEMTFEDDLNTHTGQPPHEQ